MMNDFGSSGCQCLPFPNFSHQFLRAYLFRKVVSTNHFVLLIFQRSNRIHPPYNKSQSQLMVMSASVFVLCLALLLAVVSAQVGPSWTRDNNIDAGESKPINFDKCLTTMPQSRIPGTFFNYTQSFNKTNFLGTPKVALAQLSFDINYVGSANMGYRINIKGTTSKNVTFGVEVIGVKICGLHFMYIAVSSVYDAYYFISFYNKTFDTPSDTVDDGNGTKSQIVFFEYPKNKTLPANYSNSTFTFQTWLVWYIFNPVSSISITTNSDFSNTSHYQLNITVLNGFKLNELGILGVLIDNTGIFEYQYALFIDKVYNYQKSGEPITPTSATITDFNNQYMYRGAISGLTATDIILAANVTYFYFNFTSSTSSTFQGYAINARARQCNTPQTYYFYENKTCILSCPQYYYSNVTYKYCKKCHYSCQSCSLPTVSNACTLCEASSFRELLNSSCSCKAHYYQNNTLICANCYSNCLTCSNQLANGCLSCDNTLNRLLSNGTCVCISAYYSSGMNCLPCSLGCLNCTGSNSCTLCNSSSHFSLNSGQCSCQSSYTLLQNQSCVLSPTCGNGLLQLPEQCDDDNNENGDGCSSNCTIETSYTCINNMSVYAYSLCYYSGEITLGLDYVYKIPLENQVQVILSVSAKNINQTALKKYLETRAAVAFKGQRRLLFDTITQQTVSYDTTTAKLTISFAYSSNLDLPSISLQLKPSLSNQPTARLFYATPTTDIALASPNNKLLTTYLQASDLSRQTIITYLFLTLIILSWVYLVFAVAYNQGAMAVEFFMILQVTYESLLQSGFIYDGWIGLIFFGKFTYGLNASSVISAGPDTLKTLGLTIPLLNTLNITVALCFLAVLLVLIIFIYELAEISKDSQLVESKATHERIELPNDVEGRERVEFNRAAFEIKRGIFLVCLEAGFALVFVTCRIVVISLSIAIKEARYVASSLFPALTLAACALVLFLFYYKFFDFEAMASLSYRRLLGSLKKGEQASKTLSGTSLSNFLIKYHYLLIFVLMLIFAVVDAVASIGAGLYLSVAIGALLWWVATAVNGNYLRKLHTARSAINTLCLITTMVTLLVQTLNILNPSQNIIAPLIGLSMLFLSLIFHVSILVRIEYKRRRKRTYKQKVNKVDNLKVLKQQMDTEIPVALVRHREDHAQIDRSHIDLALASKQKQKFDDFSVSNDDSRQYTRKKIITDDRFNDSTRQKEYPRPLPHSAQKMHEAEPQGRNVQLAEEEQSQENESSQQLATATAAKVKKQINFDNY